MLKSYDKKFNMAGFNSNSSLVYLCEILKCNVTWIYGQVSTNKFKSCLPVHKTTPSHFKSANAVTKDFLKKSRNNAPSKNVLRYCTCTFEIGGGCLVNKVRQEIEIEEIEIENLTYVNKP